MVDQPHWLKCFVLRFSVLIASKLDDKIVPRSNSSNRTSDKKADSMATTKPPVDTATHRKIPQDIPEQQIAAGPAVGPASLSQASALGWLPPALLPPKADANGKQKQSKKLMKQRAGGGRERAAPPPAQPQRSAGSSDWEGALADAPAAGSRMSAAMSDSGEDMSTAKAFLRMAAPHSLDALQTSDSPMANGHTGGHSRAASEGSDASGESQKALC